MDNNTLTLGTIYQALVQVLGNRVTQIMPGSHDTSNIDTRLDVIVSKEISGKELERIMRELYESQGYTIVHYAWGWYIFCGSRRVAVAGITNLSRNIPKRIIFIVAPLRAWDLC